MPELPCSVLRSVDLEFRDCKMVCVLLASMNMLGYTLAGTLLVLVTPPANTSYHTVARMFIWILGTDS